MVSRKSLGILELKYLQLDYTIAMSGAGRLAVAMVTTSLQGLHVPANTRGKDLIESKKKPILEIGNSGVDKTRFDGSLLRPVTLP